jgi:hypothetical protein
MAGELIPRSNYDLTTYPTDDGSDQDIYDLRRQIEARQTVRDYVRTEIDRLKAFDQQLVQEITALDLRLRNRKPADEPRNKRFLYKPGTEGNYQLKAGEGGAIEGEIVQ